MSLSFPRTCLPKVGAEISFTYEILHQDSLPVCRCGLKRDIGKMNNKIKLSEAKCTCVLVVKRAYEIPGLHFAPPGMTNSFVESEKKISVSFPRRRESQKVKRFRIRPALPVGRCGMTV